MKKKLLFLLSLLAAMTIGVASATACDNGKPNSSASNTESGTESGTESDTGVKETYTIKFVDEDGTELSSATYEEGATVEAPAAPTKADADGYTYTFAGWDKEVTAATADVTYTATYTKTAIEYTITFMDGETVVATIPFTVETTEIQAPEVPVRPGYENGAWSAYDLTKLENQTVTVGGYTMATYTITFVNGEEVVETVTFNLETTEIQEPTVPEIAHYTCYWGEYDLTNYSNQTVELVREAIEYKVEFVNSEDMVIARTVKFTIETIGDVVFPEVPADYQRNGYTAVWTLTPADLQLENCTATVTWTINTYTISFVNGDDVITVPFTVETDAIDVPEIPAREHYTGAWGAYDLTKAENQTVELTYKATEYTITFMFGVEVVATEIFTIEDTEISVPAIPTIEGFEGGEWSAFDTTRFENQTSTLINYTASTYTIIFDANGGTSEMLDMQVTFGEGYTLPVATPTTAGLHFNGWVDEKGNAVPSVGTWKTASNVTLKAVYSNTITFDGGVVPATFTKADTTASLDIVNIDGNNVLRLTNSNNAPAMMVTTAWLAEYFADENVDYIAFDAKADIDMNNFRRVTLRANGTFAADCYEHDMTYTHDADGDGTVESYPTTGIRADAWKTFYFSRADYNAWVAQGVTSERFIAAGQFKAGQNIYIDNIRPVTAAERKAGIGSFESGGIRINDAGKTLLFYTLDQGTTWQFNMQVSGVFTNVGLTNEKVTDGIAALTFTKPAGKLSINLTDGRAVSDAIVKTTSYWAVDIYVPENSDATMTYHTTNWSGVTLKKGAWTTIYVADSKNQLVLSDTTGGTYCVDNIRSITADEYALAGLSFEANVSGLRNHELDKVNENTGKNEGVAYYYAGKDYGANKFSFAMGEGNGEADANVLGAVRYDNTIAHSGNYSLAIEKNAGYLYFTMRNDSATFELLKDGFTFWIYSTVDIDGVNTKNIVNGCNEKFNGGEGIYIPANTWTQITVTAADMNPTRFLILQGNVAGTIYFDEFKPLN